MRIPCSIPYRQRGDGLQVSDDAVPGGADVRRCEYSQDAGVFYHQRHCRIHRSAGRLPEASSHRKPVDPVSARGAANRDREPCVHWSTVPARCICAGQ